MEKCLDLFSRNGLHRRSSNANEAFSSFSSDFVRTNLVTFQLLPSQTEQGNENNGGCWGTLEGGQPFETEIQIPKRVLT